MDATRSLEGPTALVTGATSGTGRPDAEEFGRLGAAVIVHGRDIVRDDDVVHAILADRGRARFLVADLENVCEVQGLARESGPMAPGVRCRTSFLSLEHIQQRGK